LIDVGMCERAALAHTAPCATSPASAVILARSVARVMGGRSPHWAPPVLKSSRNARMSDSGLPTVILSRLWVGPWLIPMPKRKRPPESSWISAAVAA
jgi:hypothetical protein